MAVPLLTLTQKPVQYPASQFGGDDRQLSFLGRTFVQWGANVKKDTWKANFIFIVKQAFIFLDRICIGALICGEGGFVGKIEQWSKHPIFCAFFLERNRKAREKIVDALGGVEFCRKKIPVVELRPLDQYITSSLALKDEYFAQGESIVQGEDPAGRKFVVFRLCDTDKRRVLSPFIVTVHQQHRETDADKGDKWSLCSGNYPNRPRDIDEIAQFITEVMQSSTPSPYGEFLTKSQYRLWPKP